ncbi:MAG: hypothetical protein K0S38_875, partial [Candidatus Paceibacter sp.]|nr:hypothetical protein [Candidatus Paceibacter sp.]
RGYDATRTFLKENPKIKQEILEKIRQQLKDDKTLSIKGAPSSADDGEAPSDDE